MLTLEDVRGIPEFWLTALKNVDHIADMIQVGTCCLVHQLGPLVYKSVNPGLTGGGGIGNI